MIGRGAGAGAAAHAGGDEHHVRAGQMIGDLVDRLLSRGAADFRLRAGAEALGHRHAHLDEALGLGHVSACASVLATTNSKPEPGLDHVVDGVAAGAADPEHGDPRPQFLDVGHLQIDSHGTVLSPCRQARHRRLNRRRSHSRQKLSLNHRPTREKYPPCRSCGAGRPRGRRTARSRRPADRSEGRRRREGRALGRLRQARNAERAPEPDVAGKDAPRRLGDAGQLAGAAGQHHAPADQGGEARGFAAGRAPARGSPRRAGG